MAFNDKDVIHTSTTPAAQLGRNPNGVAAMRDEWWNSAGKNDQEQATVGAGAGYANAEAARKRGPGVVADTGLSNNVAGGAGGNVSGATGLARTMAMGQSPSQGAYQLQRGLDQASAQQAAIGHSARGGAALATAGANAGYNTANLQQNAFTQGGLLRSQDMAAGRGLYATQLGANRTQAGQAIGIGNELAQGNASRNDEYSLGMGGAGVGLGQVGNAQNNQDLAAYQGGMGAVDAQSEAYQAQQRWIADERKRAISANEESL